MNVIKDFRDIYYITVVFYTRVPLCKKVSAEVFYDTRDIRTGIINNLRDIRLDIMRR